MKDLLNTLTNTAIEDVETRNNATVKKALESLVKKDFKANLGIDKAVSAEFDTFKALILEAHKLKVFENAGLLKALNTLVKTVFAEREHVATARITVLNNVAKVAFGQTVGREADKTKRTLKGFGFSEVERLMNEFPTIKDFKREIALALPSARESGKTEPAKRQPRQPSSGTSTKNGVNPESTKAGKVEVITPDIAFNAAIEALKIASEFLKPGTHATLLQHIHALEKELLELSNIEESETKKAVNQ